MSTLALMRWLEAAPDRYEAGMRLLTAGRVTSLHEAVAAAAAPAPGARVLEVGCGTGAVTRRLVARGADVTALDQSAAMLEQARQTLPDAGVHWLERSAAEIDALPEAAFDAVVFSLSLSEMSRSERAFVLAQARQRLAAGGRVVAADELRPRAILGRALQRAMRAPQALVGWLLVGGVSRPIPDLGAELATAGLVVRIERRWLGGTLGMLVAEPAAIEASTAVAEPAG